jgi:hypothetical protein
MNTKFTLAIIALIGIGVFALPSTMSLFAGQHSFYNIDATGNQIPCTKCHGDVKSELTSNANTVGNGPLTAGPHAAFKCEYCHRIEQGSASGDNAYMKLTYKGIAPATASIYMVLSVEDAEAHNYPDIINGTDFKQGRYLNSSATGLVVRFNQNFNMYPNGTSPAGQYEIAPPDVSLQQAYNWSTGEPLDPYPNTRYGGLNLNNTTISSSGGVTMNLTNSVWGAGSKAVNPGAAYHAASLVSCMECHGGEEPMGHYTRIADNAGPSAAARPCDNCHYGAGGANALAARWTSLDAGGFNLTGNAADTGEVEAHNAWVKSDKGVGRFGGPNGKANNDACVACHTHVAIDINFKKGYKLELSAEETAGGVYSITNSAVGGTVKVSVYGNSEGTTFAVSNKTYDWTNTYSPTLYINGTGAEVLGLNNDVNDSATALTTT